MPDTCTQGLANLYRQITKPLSSLLPLAWATSFICTLYFVQDLLLSRVKLSASANQPNMVLFDIQTAQKDKVAALTRNFQLPVLNEVPIITIRIEEINGKTAAQVRADSNSKVPARAFEGELRVTYATRWPTRKRLPKAIGRNNCNRRRNGLHIYEQGYARAKCRNWRQHPFQCPGRFDTYHCGQFREVDWNRYKQTSGLFFPAACWKVPLSFMYWSPGYLRPNCQQNTAGHSDYFSYISVIDVGLILSVLDVSLIRSAS